MGLVESLNLAAGSTPAEVIAAVGARYGKPLHLEAVKDQRFESLTALFLEMNDQGYIFYRERDPIPYQLHSVFHELGHILADHHGCTVLDLIPQEEIAEHTLGGSIKRAKARGILHDDSEKVAEAVAYLFSRLVLNKPVNAETAAFE